MALRKSSRLRIQLFDPPLPTQPTLHRKRKTGAEATRDWKKKMRENDPERWEEYMAQNKEASKAYRQSCSDEKKALQREQSRLRMQKMRDRKKAEQPGQTRLMTRAEKKEQRQQWREAKAKWWENLNPQKKRRVKEKRAAREQEKRASKKGTKKDACTPASAVNGSIAVIPTAPTSASPSSNCTPVRLSIRTPSPSSSRTLAARRKAKQRAVAALPQTPYEMVETITDLMQTLTPRKKRLLEERQPKSLEKTVGECVLQELKKTSMKRNKKSLCARQILIKACSGHLRQKGSSFRDSRKTKVASTSAAPRKKKIEESIQAFFESVAVPVPDKKHVTKSGKAAAILTMPLRDLFEDFRVTHPGATNVSFAKCKPLHIHPRRNWRLRLCLCEYCTNVDLKIHALNKIAARMNNTARIRHGYHAVDLVTCGRADGRWKKDCAYRDCAQCINKSLAQHAQRLLPQQDPVTWFKWDTQITNDQGKKVSRKMKVRKAGTMLELVQELQEEVIFLAAHLFRASWQQMQFTAMRTAAPFPRNTVGMVLDFAENFTCLFQDEIQAAHWYHEQVTVHPMVTYYACPACRETVTESLVCISDDRRHDYDAVYAFTVVAMEHLKTTRGLPVEHMIQWSDGCALADGSLPCRGQWVCVLQ